MADDVFGAGAPAERLRGKEALLRELERARTGSMTDIVATIQPDQYEIIRGPAAGLLFVQGGPGSGKTAVGLHRAAFLLYADEELARAQVLVVGPNRAFLRYIAQVLPSLGEAAVVQITLADLVGEARPVASGPHDVERLKGDARMAAVLARAVASYRREPRRALEVGWRHRLLVLDPEEVAGIAASVVDSGLPYASGRQLLREKLTARLRELTGPLDSEAEADLRRQPALRQTVDLLWPSLTPAKVVGDLLARGGDKLALAAEGVLAPDEQQRLRRRASRAWTPADGPLVDEARALLIGPTRTYGHIVVDEAQDLSPMQLRMLARRCPSGSMTLLGDLAQGTGVWAHESWTALAAHLPAQHGVRVEELELGYRSPTQVLDLANRLLPSIAPGLRPTVAVREGRTSPAFLAAPSAADLADLAAGEADRLSRAYRSVAVIVPEAVAAPVSASLRAAGVEMSDALAEGLDRPVTLVRAEAARGLEFDAVVVVEPAAIVQDAARGLRLLYVAITRPTQHLSVVHHRPLPEGLAA
jgi:DNA helicase IV